MGARSYTIKIGPDEHTLELTGHDRQAGRLTVRIDDADLELGYRVLEPGRIRLDLAHGPLVIHLAEAAGVRWVAGGGAAIAASEAPRRGAGAERELPPEITPPMPAVVVEVLVEVGQAVAKGDPAVVVSAMKMESTLVAPTDGTVAEVNAAAGDKVSPGDVLVRVEPAEEEA